MEVIIRKNFHVAFDKLDDGGPNDIFFSTVTKKLNEIFNKLYSSNGAPIYLFGLGRGGHSLIISGIFKDLLSGVIDNDVKKWGQVINGISVLPPDVLMKNTEALVLVISEWSYEIEMQLSRMGIVNVINVMPIYSAYKKTLEGMVFETYIKK